MAGGLGLGVGGREKENATNRTLLSWFYISMPSHILPIRQAHISATLGQLWNNFKTALRKLRGNFETILRQLWDNFETTLGQLWDNFETTRNIYGTILRQLQDNLETFQTFLSIYNSRSCGGAPTIQHYMLDCLLEMLFMFSTLRSPDFCLAYSKYSYFTSQKIWPSSYCSSFCSAGWQKLWHPGFRNGRKWSQGKNGWKNVTHKG